MHKPMVAGNWKMNNTISETKALLGAMLWEIKQVDGVDVVICPPFVSLAVAAQECKGSNVAVGAQNMFWEESGAFTGEIAPGMIAELCDYVIIGHSERRQYFGETDETVNRKVKAAFAHDLVPIVCVGESLELRKAGRTETWVRDQVRAALGGLSAEQVARMVIAYEPIWAIGTGLAATAEEAERVCSQVVRATVAELYGPEVAETIRIQYGGSVKPGNAAELMAQPNIDGALVGGASLRADDFVEIVRLSAQAKGLL